MELNIIKQIKALRQMLRHKPMDIVEKKEVKRELSKLRPVITRKETKPTKPAITVLVEGKELTLKEVAQKYSLDIKTVQARYKVGNRGKLLIRPSQRTYPRGHKPT